MFIKIDAHEFANAFRALRPNNFSYNGLKALFDYLEEWEEDSGEPIELDVIGICCEFSEYDVDTIDQDFDYVDGLTDLKTLDEKLELLTERTIVIPVDADTVIIQNF